MYFHTGAVERNSINPDARNPAVLPLAKDPVKNTGPDPTAHADIGSLPVSQMSGQTSPLPAVLDYVEHGIECMQIGQRDVGSLHGQTVGNSLALGLGKLHD